MNVNARPEGRPNLARGLEQASATPGAVVLDVREPQEYAQGHVPGSVNLPLGQVASISLPRQTPLFVYCLSGARSRQACAELRQLATRRSIWGACWGIKVRWYTQKRTKSNSNFTENAKNVVYYP